MLFFYRNLLHYCIDLIFLRATGFQFYYIFFQKSDKTISYAYTYSILLSYVYVYRNYQIITAK